MKYRPILKIIICIFLIVFLLPTFVQTVQAATPGANDSGVVSVGGYSLSYSWTSEYISNGGFQQSTSGGDVSVTVSSGTLTLNAKNSIYQKSGWVADSAQDARVYCKLTNSTSDTLKITYSISDTVTRPNGEAQSGTIELSPNETFPVSGSGFYVTKDVDKSSTDTTYATGTITISSIEKVENANLSLYSSSFGSYSYQIGSEDTAIMGLGGTALSDKSVQVGATITLTASVDANYLNSYGFYGWMSEGNLLSTSNPYNYTMSKNITIYPVFLPKDVITEGGTFSVNGTTYMFWHQALGAAVSSGKTVVMMAENYSLPKTLEENGLSNCVTSTLYSDYLSVSGSNYTYKIPSGVKFLIPYGSGDSGAFKSEPTNYISEANACTMYDEGGMAARNFAYRTLTVPSGVKIDCYGQINVNGQRQNDGQPYSGVALGGYGKLILNGAKDEEQLTIQSGAKLYCYGYITGAGMVNVKNGGTLHELIQVCDWPGGSNASNWNDAAVTNASLFPLSQYYVQNVESGLRINYGATASVEAVLTASGSSQTVSTAYVGTNSGLFQMQSGSYMIRRYDASRDHMNYSVYGTVNFGYLEIKKTFLGMPIINLNSSNYILPLPNNMTITIESGAVANMSKQVALMPGSEVIVAGGGTLNLSGKVYIVDVADWSTAYFFNRAGMTLNSGYSLSNKSPKCNPLPYVATLDDISPRTTALVRGYAGAERYYMDAKPCTTSGKLEVNGTLNVSGALCTTSGNSSANKAITGTGLINYTAAPNAGTLKGGYSSTIRDMTTTYGLTNMAGIGALKPFATATYHGQSNGYWYSHTITAEGGAVKITTSTATTGNTSGEVARVASGGTITFTADGYDVAIGENKLEPDENGIYTLSSITADTTLTLSALCTHENVKTEIETPATCVTDGHKAYWQCTTCELYYTDEACTTEIPNLETWLADETETGGKLTALGHTYGDTEYKWTDYTACVATRTCTVCTEETEGDTETAEGVITSEVTKAATCKEAGVTTYTATFNDATWAAQQTATEEIAIDETAHAWDNDCDTECNNGCGTTREASHNYESVVTDPTCTGGGFTTHTCSVCGHSYTDNQTSAKGCSYSDEWKTDADNHWHVCSVCGEESEKTAHTDGNNDHKCDTCEYVMSECSFTMQGDLKTAGTCMAEAVYQAKCAVCGAVSETETIKGEKDSTNHTGKDTVTGAKDATCTEAGYTGDTVCECGETVKTGEAIPAKNHNYGETSYTWADDGKSCTAKRTCANDASHVEEAAATITSKITTPASCTAMGTTTYTATFGVEWAVEQTTTRQDVAVIAHTYDQQKTEDTYKKSDATCTAAAVYYYSCSCGAKGTDTFEYGDKLAHSYGKPQFTWNGYECSAVVKCSCGDEQNVDVTVTSEVTTTATCTVEGVKTYTATTVYNGTTYVSDEHPTEKLGLNSENHVNKTEHEQTDATCTEPGYTAGTYCNDCKTWISGHEVINALEHSWTVSYEWSEDGKSCTATRACGNDPAHNETETVTATDSEKTAATCEAMGWTTYTADFGAEWAETQTKDVQDVAKLDHAYTGEIKSDGDGKDATHSFKCVNGCNEYGEAVAHTWNAGEQTKNPACEAAGEMTYTCTVEGCGATYTEEIAANGHTYGTEWKHDETNHWHECSCGAKSDEAAHTYGEWVVEKEATTTEVGSQSKTCSVCDDVVTEEIPVVEDELDPVVNMTGTVAPATVTVLDGGWKVGKNLFTVSCEKPCVVAYTTVTDGVTVYKRLTGDKVTEGDNSYYTFDVTLNTDTQIIIAINGDINFDSYIDSNDALLALKVSVGSETLSEIQKLVTDVNNDTYRDSNDALLILKYSVGSIVDF